jgi:hypothetical protein
VIRGRLPQDVTSNEIRVGGTNLQQEVVPQPDPKGLSASPHKRILADTIREQTQHTTGPGNVACFPLLTRCPSRTLESQPAR